MLDIMGTSGGLHSHRFFLHSQRTERNQHADGRTAGREPEHERRAAEVDQIPGDETSFKQLKRRMIDLGAKSVTGIFLGKTVWLND